MANRHSHDGDRSSTSGGSTSPSESHFKPEQDHDSKNDADTVLEAVEAGSRNDSYEHHETHNDLEKAVTQRSQGSPPPATEITNAQDWAGPDDPENPQNWPSWKRACHVGSIAFLSFSVTLGSSIISPAIDEIAREFKVSTTAAILSITMFVIGLGVGPMIAAPLSERFGRTMVYKLSPPIFLLFTLGAGFTKSFAGLLICRLLSATSGSPVLAVGGGTMADLFPPATRAVYTSMYIIMPFLGPAVGPVIGGFASQYKGWRWCMWCMIFVGTLGWAFCLPMQETYKKTILQRRAKKLGLPAPPSLPVTGLRFLKLVLRLTIARPLYMMVMEPVVTCFTIYSAFTFSVLYAFFDAYPYTFETVYGFNTWQSGLTFLGIGVGTILAAVTMAVCDRKIYQRKQVEALQQGRLCAAPEHRLYTAMLCAFGLPIGLFWFAWTARADIHWIVPTLAGIPFAWGNVGLFLAAALYCVDVYGPMDGASALAANGIFRYILGSCFPLFTLQMYTKLGIGWATSLLGFVCVLLLPIPFVFFKYGPQIRSKSHFDTMKA